MQLSDFCGMPEQGLETVHRWSAKKINLKAGESFDMAWGEMEYGAVILNIRAKGSIRISVGEGHEYFLNSPVFSEERCIGIRFHKTAPKFRIDASEDSVIEKIEALIQKPD